MICPAEKAGLFLFRNRNNPVYLSCLILYSCVRRCYDVFTVRETAVERRTQEMTVRNHRKAQRTAEC